MSYHKITMQDLLKTATPKEKVRLSMILDLELMKRLAQNWCDYNDYKLGGHLGNGQWDATREEKPPFSLGCGGDS